MNLVQLGILVFTIIFLIIILLHKKEIETKLKEYKQREKEKKNNKKTKNNKEITKKEDSKIKEYLYKFIGRIFRTQNIIRIVPAIFALVITLYVGNTVLDVVTETIEGEQINNTNTYTGTNTTMQGMLSNNKFIAPIKLMKTIFPIVMILLTVNIVWRTLEGGGLIWP